MLSSFNKLNNVVFFPIWGPWVLVYWWTCDGPLLCPQILSTARGDFLILFALHWRVTCPNPVATFIVIFITIGKCLHECYFSETEAPNLKNLNRITEPQKKIQLSAGSILKYWIQFQVEPTLFEPRLKFFKFGLSMIYIFQKIQT